MNENLKLPTRGEEFIQYYLEESRISYSAEYKIDNLRGDVKSFRRVDFYLPKLGFYVEYFGLYNSTKEIRAEYDLKKEVYINNRLPTIFLYPHELGFLDYAFHTQVKRLFRYEIFYNPWRLFRYSITRYLIKGRPFFFILAIYFYLMGVLLQGFDLGINNVFRNILAYSSYGVALYCLYKFIFDFQKYVHLQDIIGFTKRFRRRLLKL